VTNLAGHWPRFSLKHLLAATFVFSVCLTVYWLTARQHQRSLITQAYGSYEPYQLLTHSDRYTVSAVPAQRRVNPAIEDWNFPADNSPAQFRTISGDEAARLRELLGSPQNFIVPYTVDFMFGPTLMLQTSESPSRLKVYFDFDSKMAVVVLDDKLVRWLIIDKVASELEESLQGVRVNGTTSHD